MQLAQIDQCLNRLRRALDVERRRLGVVVTRRAVGAEEGVDEKVVALAKRALELLCASAAAEDVERFENVGRAL